MAMGGSITDTTHATVRYTPSTRAPVSHQGARRVSQMPRRGSCHPMSRPERSREGTLAPAMVSHNTRAKSPSITGMPVARLVRRRSRTRSRRWADRGSISVTSAAMAAARSITAAARLWAHPSQSPAQSSSGRGRAPGRSAASSSARRRASSPLPLRAAAPTTGQPSRSCNASRSTAICFFSASSSRLTHTTTGQDTSSTWSTRARFRSSPVASATTNVTSASPERR